MNRSFAYVINQRLPNEFALSIYLIKTCEAVKKLGWQTHLLYPKRTQPAHFPFNNIWDYYHLPKNCFKAVRFKVLELVKIPFFLEGIISHLRYQFITSTFSTQALAYLIRNNISVVQTVSREMIFLLRLAFWYRPIVIYDVHVEPKTWYEGLFDWLMRPRADLFLVNCKFFEEHYLSKGINPKKIIILPSGYDPDQFKSKGNKNDLRTRLKLPENKFIIGYIGRFEIFGEEKGVRAMLKVAASLKGKLPIAVVAVGGPDKLVKEYQRLTKKLRLATNQAIIRSQVKPDKVADYITSFDIACMLYPDVDHYREKMSPMKALEYMAAEKPIIATSLPAIRQVMSDDCAFLIDPGEQKALEDKILEIWKNPKAAKLKVKQAFDHVQQYSWLNRHEQIFNKLKRKP